jgi:hypothetical protein
VPHEVLVERAKINDFIPLFVYRFTKENLVDALAARLPRRPRRNPRECRGFRGCGARTRT